MGSAHFCHELNEQLSTTVGIDTLHETIDGTYQTVGVGKSIIVPDGRVHAVLIWGNGRGVNSCSSTAQYGNGKVWRRMSNDA